jgi:hypothetical protein
MPDDCQGRAGVTVRRHISYRFFMAGGETQCVALSFDADTHRLIVDDDAPRPDWTRLDCNRCPNCTLPDDAGHCPAALGMASFLPAFANRVSHEKAVVEVETAQRTIVAKTTFQSGLASLIGLVCATSGCPRTLFLRPMARFHLPFADEQETLFRSFSIWLLVAYIRQRKDGSGEALSLDGLKARYQELSVVNSSLAERLRTVAGKDALLNAVIILDLFAQIAPDNIDGGFEDILDALHLDAAA